MPLIMGPNYPISIYCLSADRTVGSVGTANQTWFDSGSDALQVLNTSLYLVEGFLHVTWGATATIPYVSFGGTATVTSMRYWVASARSGSPTATNDAGGFVATADESAVGTNIGQANLVVRLSGVLRTAAAGTFIPQYRAGTDTAGSHVVKANSFFALYYLGTDNSTGALTTIGPWS